MANYPNITRAALRIGGGVLLLLVIAVLIPGCMSTTVRSGESAVKYSVFGGTNLDDTVGEGLQVHAPWVDIIRYDVRIQEQLEDITALSSNGLSIGMDGCLNGLSGRAKGRDLAGQAAPTGPTLANAVRVSTVARAGTPRRTRQGSERVPLSLP